MSTLQWLQLVMGTTFVLAGVIAWRCRPGNRTGPIMALYGSTVLAGYFLQRSDVPAAITLGILIADGSAFVFMYLLLAFPSGRLSSRADWLILGPVVFVFGPLEVLWLAFLETPGNVLVVSPDADLADAIDWVQRVVLTCAVVALVSVLVTRWLRASPPMRRALAPVLAGAVALCVGIFTLLWDKIGGARTELIAWITAITFIALPVALLANLLRMRLARTAVGGLVVDLRDDPDPAHLRDALRRALGDPSLTIAFWLPEYESYADLAGNELTLPDEGPSVAITLLERGDGSRVAALIHDPSLAQHGDLLREVAAAAAMALENARLQAELYANLEELRGSRARVIEAADTERRRLERNLVAAYYLICEALTNTAKHAHASAASVAVRREPGRVGVEVDDDGVGGADTRGGSGLRGLADRVEALDGSLRVVSRAGEGTHLRAEIPCASS